ncbi:MAG: hypothetical protein ACK5L3_01475 [Oscillospiraceae bacterium]
MANLISNIFDVFYGSTHIEKSQCVFEKEKRVFYRTHPFVGGTGEGGKTTTVEKIWL